jgi:hypothetical protein
VGGVEGGRGGTGEGPTVNFNDNRYVGEVSAIPFPKVLSQLCGLQRRIKVTIVVARAEYLSS